MKNLYATLLVVIATLGLFAVLSLVAYVEQTVTNEHVTKTTSKQSKAIRI